MRRTLSDLKLRPVFGLPTTTYVVIASMVGTGILTTSGYIVAGTGSGTVMLGLWMVGGLLALCGALSVAELAAAMPRAGGEYVYMREAYGPVAGFLYGWVSFIIGFSAPTAITAYAAARYMLGPLPHLPPESAVWVARVAAAGIIVLSTLAHVGAVRTGRWTQDASTLAKIVLLGLLVIAGLAFGRGSTGHLQADVPARLPWSAMAISLVYVMFSYSGWNAATYLGDEVRSAPRLLPRALILGCASVVALYLLLNVTYLYALAPSEISKLPPAQLEAIAATAAQRLFGPWIARPLSVAIGVGLLATVSAFILTGPRIYYAMARDGLFPAAAGRLNQRTGAPVAATLAQCACSLALLFSGGFQNVMTYAGVGLSVSAFFVIAAVFVLRIRRPELPRPFRTPLYPLTPALFLACTGWMIVWAFQQQPRWSAISLASIAAGVPVYLLWHHRGKETQRRIEKQG